MPRMERRTGRAAAAFPSGRGKILLVLLCAAVLALTAACDKPADRLQGRWRTTGEGATLVYEFGPKGRVIVGTDPGQYSFGDNDRLKVQTRFATYVYRYSVEGDRLTLQDTSGATRVLERAP